MCQYSSEDGFATDWHLVHLGSRAVGGAGLMFVEATAVSPEGRISPGDMGIWRDEHIEKLSQIVRFVHSQGVGIWGYNSRMREEKRVRAAPGEGVRGLIGPEEGGWYSTL